MSHIWIDFPRAIKKHSFPFLESKQEPNEVLHLRRYSSTRRRKMQKLTEEDEQRKHLEARFSGTQKTSMASFGKKGIPSLFPYDVKCKKPEHVMLLFILKVNFHCKIETSILKHQISKNSKKLWKQLKKCTSSRWKPRKSLEQQKKRGIQFIFYKKTIIRTSTHR